MTPGTRLRAAALLAVGAVAVHQLRFLLAFGGDAQGHPAADGHGYLHLAVPAVAVFAALACAHFLLAIQRTRGRAPGDGPRWGWLAASAALLLVYSVQEGAEAAIAAGHPAGVAGIFGGGGWVAIPLCLAAGAVVALGLRGAESVLARAHPALVAVPRPRPVSRAPWRYQTRALLGSPLARHLSGRAPPAPAT